MRSELKCFSRPQTEIHRQFSLLACSQDIWRSGKENGFWQLSWMSPASQLLHFMNPICHPGAQSHLHLSLGQWEGKEKGSVTWEKNWKMLSEMKPFLVMQLLEWDCKGRSHLLFLREICKLHSLWVLLPGCSNWNRHWVTKISDPAP